MPLRREVGDSADRQQDQNRKCACDRKFMENMAVFFSNFGTGLNRFSPRCDSPSANNFIEREGLGTRHPANVFFVLNVKGEADIFGFDSEHRDIEQTLTLE